LENDGQGNFKNITRDITPELEKIGMITDAKFTDITGDEKPELVLVGEWMYPRIFSVNDGQFSEIKTNLTSYSGWYYTLETKSPCKTLGCRF